MKSTGVYLNKTDTYTILPQEPGLLQQGGL